MADSAAVAAVRLDWHLRAAEVFQRLAGARAERGQLGDCTAAADLANVAESASRAEQIVLRGMAAELLLRRCLDEGLMLADRTLRELVSTAVIRTDDSAHDLRRMLDAIVAGGCGRHGGAMSVLGMQVRRVVDEREVRLTIRQIARILGETPERVSRAFQETFGLTVTQHAARRLTGVAVHRLRNTTDPTKEIAWDLGYKSRKNFNRVLKAQTGYTPTQIRRTGPTDGPLAVTRPGDRRRP